MVTWVTRECRLIYCPVHDRPRVTCVRCCFHFQSRAFSALAPHFPRGEPTLRAQLSPSRRPGCPTVPSKEKHSDQYLKSFIKVLASLPKDRRPPACALLLPLDRGLGSVVGLVSGWASALFLVRCELRGDLPWLEIITFKPCCGLLHRKKSTLGPPNVAAGW